MIEGLMLLVGCSGLLYTIPLSLKMRMKCNLKN